jgi:hypothetical protein
MICTYLPRRGTAVLAICFVFLAMLALLALSHFAPAFAQSPDLPQESGLPDPCAQVGAIPTNECRALVDLYQATDGPRWRAQSGWLEKETSPCDWFGVSCENGHVTALTLNANRLQGTVLPTLCPLAEFASADIGYNQIETRHASVESCLAQMDPDWAQTQTIAPGNVRVNAVYTDALDLAWDPIAYTADGGFYAVSYALSVSGTYTVHGQTQDKAVDHYRLDGLEPGQTYAIQVRTYTPAHVAQPDPLWSEPAHLLEATQSSDGRILLAIFFPADNDLSPYVPDLIDRLRRGSARNPNVVVALLVDQNADGDTLIYEIVDGQVTPTPAVQMQWGTDELDTADAEVLAWFLTYARTTYAASRIFVSIMGHGVGLIPKIAITESETKAEDGIIAQPVTRNTVPALPRGLDATPGDMTNQSYMSTVELGQALRAASQQGNAPFDLLFFDQCFAGNHAVLYEIRQAAQIVIASPNYAWLAAPYHKYLTHFTPAASAETIANAILHYYQYSLDDRHPNAIFWLHQRDIEAISSAVDALADALIHATQAGEDARILNAALNSLFVDTTQCQAEQFALQPPDEMIGASSFAANLKMAFPAGDLYGVHAAADHLIDALSPLASNYRVGYPYIAPSHYWGYTDTVTLLAPLQRTLPATTVWRASIYTETVPLSATWAAAGDATVAIDSAFAAAQDGRWDDFLAVWYQDLQPVVGQWCHYTPPVRVMDDTVETLTLSAVAEGERAVRLTWTASENQDAVAYWLFTRQAAEEEWALYGSTAISQTTALIDELQPGVGYFYEVLARSEEGIFVAESNAVEWIVPAAPIRFYLPLIER